MSGVSGISILSGANDTAQTVLGYTNKLGMKFVAPAKQ
jgi:hypothetical protein